MGRPRPELRAALQGLDSYIVTSEVAKHRVFTTLEWPEDLIDGSVIAIATDDPIVLGVMSSVVSATWSLVAAGTLEDRPRFHTTTSFDPFPFPDLHAADKFAGPIGVAVVNPDGTTGASETFGDYPSDRIRVLGEQLDAHRKRQQAAHPELTLTGMYNVLEKLKTGEALTLKEKVIHEQGLVSVLKTLHDELDAAVLAAYGWGDLAPLLADAAQKEAASETLLVRLVALNAERAAEEAKGQIRWLRPEYQHPAGKPTNAGAANALAEEADQDAATGDDTTKVASSGATPRDPWPASLPEQVAAVARVLAASSAPLTLADLAARFTGKGPWKKRLPQIIDTLEALGRARRDVEGRVVG